MEGILSFVFVAAATFFVLLIGEPILRLLLLMFGVYTVVEEGTAHVYILFGKVVAVLREPGLHWLWVKIGPQAGLVRWLGELHVLDMRLDQVYLRSQPVNSEEGAPMGIGIWYEMSISDPVAYLFRNTDPRGSLAANVSNATVRSLSNMALDDKLQTRHVMSRTVRAEVSPLSEEWGYKLGSTYIRKVHFRDVGMINQIEAKVTNRLRQVTSAILQDGENRVSLIANAAERKAAVAFAQANATRPKIVGEALNRITEDPEVARAMFDILEIEQILAAEENEIILVPEKREFLSDLMATW